MKKILFIAGVAAITGLGAYALLGQGPKTSIAPGPEKISVVTTLFPQYDFAKAIGGDKIGVSLLLPPGVEAHAYEPKPSDISRINSARVFVYTGETMEPWAHELIAGVDKKVRIVDASAGVELMKEEEEEEHEEGHHHHDGTDPHIWLDFDNAGIMAANIAQALAELDPENAQFYRDNLRSYQAKLAGLDGRYRDALSACPSRTIIYGGHYAFGYLAKRWSLEYVSAQGFSPDAEPTAKDLIALVEQVKKDGIGYIFYAELASPKIAETLAQETGAKLLLLNGAHNLAKDDYEAGATYLSIMEKNLENLALGLGCLK